MNIDMDRIGSLYARMMDLSRRANEVIANAQKQRYPFDSLNDAQRLFCGFLAHEGKQLLIPAATKIGLKIDQPFDADFATTVGAFFTKAGPFLGTNPAFVETAYVNAAEILINSADDLIVRAERVLNGQGSMAS